MPELASARPGPRQGAVRDLWTVAHVPMQQSGPDRAANTTYTNFISYKVTSSDSNGLFMLQYFGFNST